MLVFYISFTLLSHNSAHSKLLVLINFWEGLDHFARQAGNLPGCFAA